MQFGTRRIASPHSLGSTASSGKWNRMGAHCSCSGARRYPTRSTRALASLTALYDAKRSRLNNKIERSCWPELDPLLFVRCRSGRGTVCRVQLPHFAWLQVLRESSMKNSERSSIKSSEEDACAAVADAVVHLFDVELNREGRTLRAAENVFGVVRLALTMRIDEIEKRERNSRG